MKFPVVIPVYNEENSVISLYYYLKEVLDKLNEPYEIIFVDDGSTDLSVQKLKSINLSPANLNCCFKETCRKVRSLAVRL